MSGTEHKSDSDERAGVPPRARRWIFLAAGAALSGLFIYLVVSKVDLDLTWQRIKSVNPIAFLLFPLMRGLNFVVPALRSRVLFAPIAPLPLWRLIKSVLLAFAVNAVIPFRAGEIARIGYLSRYSELPLSTTTAVVAFERLLDLIAFLIILVCLLPVMSVDLPLGSSLYILGGVVAVVIALSLWASRGDGLMRLVAALTRPFGQRVSSALAGHAKTFSDGLQALRSPLAILSALALTLSFWFVGILILKMWLWAFAIELPWYGPVVIISFLSLGLAVPSAPGNFGTYHWLVIQALAVFGLSEAVSAPYAVVVHAMATLPFTLLAIPLLYRDYAAMTKDPKNKEPPPSEGP